MKGAQSHITEILPSALSSGLDSWEALSVDATRPRLKILDAGENLYFQDEATTHVYFLLRGWAMQETYSNRGRRRIFDFAFPGAVLGLASQRHPTGLATLTTCKFSMFKRSRFRDLLRAVPKLSIRLLDKNANDQEHAVKWHNYRGPAGEATAQFLFDLVVRASQSNGHASMLLPISELHVADALGFAHETISRAIAPMRKSGIVALGINWIEILDVEQLAARASVPATQIASLRRLLSNPRQGPSGQNGQERATPTGITLPS